MSTFFEITDGEGNDLLGCWQEGIGSARMAARTMIEDGHERANIYRIMPSGRRAPFPFEYARRDPVSGQVELRGSSLSPRR